MDKKIRYIKQLERNTSKGDSCCDERNLVDYGTQFVPAKSRDKDRHSFKKFPAENGGTIHHSESN
jgi:hypothetical protein